MSFRRPRNRSETSSPHMPLEDLPRLALTDKSDVEELGKENAASMTEPRSPPPSMAAPNSPAPSMAVQRQAWQRQTVQHQAWQRQTVQHQTWQHHHPQRQKLRMTLPHLHHHLRLLRPWKFVQSFAKQPDLGSGSKWL